MRMEPSHPGSIIEEFYIDELGLSITAIANAVVPLVQRSLEPFDINVAVGNAANLADAVNAVGANAGDMSGEFDAYLFVTNVTSDDATLNVPGGLFGRWPS